MRWDMIKKVNKEFLILFLVLILAGLLRFWQLGQAPPSPDWDEAALGYNAYSLLKTGRDEYGQPWPLVMRSFDDYKPAIYAYLAILPIKIFGLNLFATRFPAAFLGTLTVLLTYFLVRELFPSQPLGGGHSPTIRGVTYGYQLSVISSLLLAISPWHLQFSRVAFESNVGLFFDILTVWLILKAFKKPWLLVLAAFSAGLSLYVYQAEKVFVPFLVLAIALIWRKSLLKLPRKYLVLGLLVGAICLLPLVKMTLTTPEIFLRAKGTSLTADQTPFLAWTAEKLARDYQDKDYLGLILDNRRVTYFLAFLRGYFSHFDLNWLFITGGEARHHAPGIGVLYLWELPFLVWGIYGLIFSRVGKKSKLLIFLWFLLAPIPAAFTTGAPHEVRTIRLLPIFQILVAFGLIRAWQILNKKRLILQMMLIGAGGLFFIFNSAYYLNQYFVQQNYFNSQSWQYGYQQAVEEIKKIEPQYQKIVVSNQPYLDQSYMFFLFYLKFDPATYQQLGGTVSGGFAENHRGFGKYTFRPIAWEKEVVMADTLYVGRPGDFSGQVKILKTIYFLDGQPAILIATK